MKISGCGVMVAALDLESNEKFRESSSLSIRIKILKVEKN